MPNSIPEQQNSESTLRLLRARQQIYKEAERLQLGQFTLTVLTPFVGGLLAITYAEIRPYISALAVFITIADVALIDRALRHKLKTAAKIAERFDCDLLGMPWNKFAVGKQIDPELIDTSARAWKGGDERLIDWYPTAVGRAPLYMARLACQRANLWYDSTLRRFYSKLLTGGAFLLLVILAILGFAATLTLDAFVFSVLVPAAPLLVWAIRDRFRQIDAADAIETVKAEAEALTEKVASGDCLENECTVRSREFQDAIYNRRATMPLIFPFIYKLKRSKMETGMNAGADDVLKRMGV